MSSKKRSVQQWKTAYDKLKAKYVEGEAAREAALKLKADLAGSEAQRRSLTGKLGALTRKLKRIEETNDTPALIAENERLAGVEAAHEELKPKFAAVCEERDALQASVARLETHLAQQSATIRRQHSDLAETRNREQRLTDEAGVSAAQLGIVTAERDQLAARVSRQQRLTAIEVMLAGTMRHVQRHLRDDGFNLQRSRALLTKLYSDYARIERRFGVNVEAVEEYQEQQPTT